MSRFMTKQLTKNKNRDRAPVICNTRHFVTIRDFSHGLETAHHSAVPRDHGVDHDAAELVVITAHTGNRHEHMIT